MTLIAVIRLHTTNVNGKEFINEVGSNSWTSHANVVVFVIFLWVSQKKLSHVLTLLKSSHPYFSSLYSSQILSPRTHYILLIWSLATISTHSMHEPYMAIIEQPDSWMPTKPFGWLLQINCIHWYMTCTPSI